MIPLQFCCDGNSVASGENEKDFHYCFHHKTVMRVWRKLLNSVRVVFFFNVPACVNNSGFPFCFVVILFWGSLSLS